MWRRSLRSINLQQRMFEVIVGNIGCVYRGHSRIDAVTAFVEYKEQSTKGYGRATGEPVTLLSGGEPLMQHDGEPHNIE